MKTKQNYNKKETIVLWIWVFLFWAKDIPLNNQQQEREETKEEKEKERYERKEWEIAGDMITGSISTHVLMTFHSRLVFIYTHNISHETRDPFS